MGCVPFDPDFGCCSEWASLDPALQERAETLAWSTLRGLTGGRVGNCPTVVRPCLTQPCNVCSPWWQPPQWVQAGLHDGNWINCLCATPECSCTKLCEIVVAGPIAALIDIQVGDCHLPLDIFRVDNGNRIVRMDGCCWPSCQNMGAPLGKPGTMGITYIAGIIPDEAGLWAAGVLACEFAKACDPAGTSGKCRLPSSVTTIARQGVAMTMSATMFPDNQTGIREVDAYVLGINPNGLKMPSTVWSPDVPWAKHRYETPTVRIEP